MFQFLLFSFILISTSVGAQSSFIFETGAVWQYRNDVRITPDDGDTLEFDKFEDSPTIHHRIEYHYNLSKKHGLRFIYAPYQVTVKGSLDKDIRFQDEVFNKDQTLKVKYKFNSYRLGYKYFYSDNFTLGASLKIRDAKISLEQSDKKESYDNIGFVPLFYASYKAQLNPLWYFYTDADFAAAAQGRAIDLTLKLRRSITKASDLGLGLRSLEGGADNDKVYTFSWLNYFILDYQYSF